MTEPSEIGSRIEIGDRISERDLVGVIGGTVAIPPPAGLVHVQLRRFAGCMVCNLHLKQVVDRLPEIEAAGISEVVVFHSSAAEIRTHEKDLPMTVVADPHQALYREFGVGRSRSALLAPGVIRRLPRAVLDSVRTALTTRRLPPLRPTGGELGLPADLLIDRNGIVVGVKYGENASDQWSVDQLLALADSITGA